MKVPTNSKEIIKTLKEAGFFEESCRGSHVKMKHADGRMTIVPHPKKDLPLGTSRNIFRQAKIEI